jgi:hypothetical protein
MIIKNKKKNIFFYISILTIALACFASFLSMDRELKKKLWFDQYINFYDYFLTFDLGFSSIRAIALNQNYLGTQKEDTSFFDRVVLGYAGGLGGKIPEIFSKKIQGFPARPPLKAIYIDIKFQDYKQLLEDREKAMRLEINHQPNKIKAELWFKGKTYNAKVRLKGNLMDHWRSRHKMSLRVEIKGKNYILGFKKFSLHKAGSRQFPFDHVFQSLMGHLGNLSSVHKYAHVFVNGESWGIMDLEEHVSKEFLEKQKKKDSIIVEFGDRKLSYEYKKKYQKSGNQIYPHYRLYDLKLNMHLYSQNKNLKSKGYREWFTYIAESRLAPEDNTELYDIDRYALTVLLAKIWNNCHSLGGSNLRNYFNPYLLKLEPITTDQAPYSLIKDIQSVSETCPPNGIVKDIYSQIIKTRRFETNFSKNYRAVLNVLKDIKSEFADAQKYFPVDNKIDGNVINSNIRMFAKLSDKDMLKLNSKTDDMEIIDSLPSDQQAKDLPRHLVVRYFENGVLKIYNLLPDTVILEKLIVDNKTAINLNLEIPGYLPGSYEPYIFQTKLRGVYDNRIAVETVYRGNHRNYVIGPTLLKGVRNPLLISEMKSDHKFLKKTEGGNWKISGGSWNVDEPIVIRGNLIVEEGVELYFSSKAYLIVIGSIHANGTSGSKIIFAPQMESWKGLYVIGDGGKSSELTNVVIRSPSRLKHDMLNLTGGVTFYDADVLLEDVLFENSYAEDALNLVRSKYSLKEVHFKDMSSDALDSDFSSGKIINSNFNSILGDALDFSGSYCDIKNISISDVKDKAISVGEKSNVIVDITEIDKVGVGIAVKDGSSATVSNSSIKNHTLYAAMTYDKKGFYEGKSRLDIFNVEVEGDHPFAMQEQTKLLVDGFMVPEKNIDVRALYQTEEMGK